MTALGLSVLAVTTPKAQAWCGGWPIAAGVVGGLAVGTCIGATVAHASAPVYAYPAPVAVAPAPAYVAPPAVVVQAPVYAPAPVVYAAPYPYYYRGYYRAPVRVGWGWGPRGYYHHYRR